MDAETYVKMVKRICESSFCPNCPLADEDKSCTITLSYEGNKNPVPIVEQWLAEHPEPKSLPELPGKLLIEGKDMWKYDTNDILTALMRNQNAIIDYLKEKEKE